MKTFKVRTLAFGSTVALATLAILMVLQVGSVRATHGTGEVWGYQSSASNAVMGHWDLGLDSFLNSCVPASGTVPPHLFGNGRGVAQDPTDGNLWYTVLNAGLLTGDGLIHKTTPPPTCTDVTSIPAPQTSIGALDLDPDDGHLWAAGYDPIGGLSFFYKVSVGPVPAPGTVMQFCNVPFGGGGAGNDTLAVAKLTGLAGSGKYLLTDAGEFLTSLKALDAAACVGGGTVAPVTTFTLPVGVTGCDYEPVGGGPKLICSTGQSIVSLGSAPFSSVVASMSTSPVGNTIEDISLKTAPIIINVPVDIRPTSCPNPLNTKENGVLPVAILGTSTFDVTKVDVSTVKLAGVSPLRSELEDVAAPFSPFTGKSNCTTDCNTSGPDGFTDLTLKFDTQAVIAALGAVTNRECRVLKLTGNLLLAFGGTPIAGEDVVVILAR